MHDRPRVLHPRADCALVPTQGPRSPARIRAHARMRTHTRVRTRAHTCARADGQVKSISAAAGLIQQARPQGIDVVVNNAATHPDGFNYETAQHVALLSTPHAPHTLTTSIPDNRSAGGNIRKYNGTKSTPATIGKCNGDYTQIHGSTTPIHGNNTQVQRRLYANATATIRKCTATICK